MNESPDILMRVRQSAAKRILFLPYAIRQMSRVDRMISTADIRTVIEHGEVIEDYPEDVRGHSCLCQQCGEVYFDKPEVDSIQEIIRAIEDRAKKLTVAA